MCALLQHALHAATLIKTEYFLQVLFKLHKAPLKMQ